MHYPTVRQLVFVTLATNDKAAAGDDVVLADAWSYRHPSGRLETFMFMYSLSLSMVG